MVLKVVKKAGQLPRRRDTCAGEYRAGISHMGDDKYGLGVRLTLDHRTTKVFFPEPDTKVLIFSPGGSADA